MSSPSFNRVDLPSSESSITLMLAGERGKNYHAMGTAFVISQNLAITAAHVIRELEAGFDGRERDPRGKPEDYDSSFSIRLANVTKERQVGEWTTSNLKVSRSSDIALIVLKPLNETASNHQWALPQISLSLPKIKTSITAFGFREQSYDGRSWNVSATRSTGIVQEVHPRQRDNSFLRYPCFRTNAQLDPAMSGGPVFDQRGNICGMICTNLPPEKEDQDHISHVSLLYPLMGIYDPVRDLTVMEIADLGEINLLGRNRVIANKNNVGRVISTSLLH